MNLHGIVRGAIGSVNPDTIGVWRESTGNTIAAGGRTEPTYTDHAGVGMQVQALSGRDLRHSDFLSMQGVKRAVYLFGNVEGVNRPAAKGGDLLIFPETRGGPDKTWLVVVVLESWMPDVSGWSKVGVVLQADEEIPS